MIEKSTKEKILFEIDLIPDYWDKPPHVKIYINQDEKFSDFITEKIKIKFNHTLDFDKKYTLKILRSNWDEKQVIINKDGSRVNQSLLIDKLKIDGINCQGLINNYGYAIYEYPEAYFKENQNLGIKLPFKTPAATLLTFNANWIFNFSSPFYVFVMKWMGGGVFNE